MSAVRPFAPADAPGWVALSNLVFDRRNTVENFRVVEGRRRPDELMRRWVAQDGEEMIGGAALYSWPFAPPGFLNSNVFVHPDRRGRGLGQALWATVWAAAQEQSALGLMTEISDLDPQSMVWAERRGFATHVHRYASELNLTTFDETPHLPSLARAEAQGITFTDLAAADGATLERYLNFVADRLTETPDLAGNPRWPLTEVRSLLRLDTDPRPDWLFLAVEPGGEWLGTTALIRFKHLNMAYNELTATHPEARGRGLALPLKLHAIREAQAEGLSVMRTNNHSLNAPMLAVNRKLGFVQQLGKYEMRFSFADR